MSPPLLKWPGGKRKLLKHILPLIPTPPNRYFEPFAGSAAVFLSLRPASAILSDTNAELINCYQQVRDYPEEVILRLATLKADPDTYLEVRAKVPSEEVARAARFIYLTTLSFNGIYRTNLKGDFNVPYGHRPHLHPKEPALIRAISRALSVTELRCVDFASALAEARQGDVVYLDPPYTVAHGNNGFLRYNAKIFSWADQTRLAELSHQLVERGCQVVISNADHPSILALYEKFRVHRIERQSSVAGRAEGRRRISECIFHSQG
ncbi:MAG TPA: Dam family site-specific DNA-(adenine-N6)-methyltransferase [Longimicrobiaceae bacterium]